MKDMQSPDWSGDSDPRKLIGNEAPASVPCSLVHDLLPAAIGGELEPETETVLERHVGQCLGCAREWRALQDSQLALRTVAEGTDDHPDFDDGFFADLHAGIVGEVRRQSTLLSDTEHLRQQVRGRRRRAASASWLPIAGTLAATLLVGFLVGKWMDGYRAPRSVNLPSAVSAQLDLDPEVVADPAFETYLLDAWRRFVERKAGTMRIEPGANLVVPVQGGSKADDPHETDI